jgi:hypothetical protein
VRDGLRTERVYSKQLNELRADTQCSKKPRPSFTVTAQGTGEGEDCLMVMSSTQRMKTRGKGTPYQSPNSLVNDLLVRGGSITNATIVRVMAKRHESDRAVD